MKVKASTLFRDGFDLRETNGSTLELVNDIGDKGKLLVTGKIGTNGVYEYSGKSKGRLILPACINKIIIKNSAIEELILHPKFNGEIQLKNATIENMGCNIAVKVTSCEKAKIKKLQIFGLEEGIWENVLDNKLYDISSEVITDGPFIVLNGTFLPAGSISRYVRKELINRANTMMGYHGNKINRSELITGVRPKDGKGTLEIKRNSSDEIKDISVSYEIYMNFCEDYMRYLKMEKKA